MESTIALTTDTTTDAFCHQREGLNAKASACPVCGNLPSIDPARPGYPRFSVFIE